LPPPRALPPGFGLRCVKEKKVPIAVTVLVAALLLAVIALAARKCPACPSCPAPAAPGCPESGIGLGEKCFYVLEDEADWDASQASCLALGAHLAALDSREELDFLLRYGRAGHYWLGLRREGSAAWRWLNGTLLSD
ncbi:CLC2E protein, partial [Lophotis ruficrista]|nr:CLC2E protein [Lophotis ruficrista]